MPRTLQDVASTMGAILFVMIAITFGGFFLWSAKFGGLLPKSLRSRSCQGEGWRAAFPAASKQQIRELLSLFVSAFGFYETEKLKLSPNDPLLQIYRSLHPHRGQADALEFETLVEDLSRKYRVDLVAVWREDLTLGELFAHTTAVIASPPPP
jgi:propanediol dehydratase small subunit